MNSIKPLLDFIGKYESNNDYTVVWGGARRPELLTSSIDSVYRIMDDMLNTQRLKYGRAISTAVGKYQIIRKTLLDLSVKIPSTRVFDETLQDELAIRLLNRRKLQSYLNGTITEHEFALEIAKEWASMPTSNNKSYYDGDGINSTKVDYETFINVIKSIKNDSV